MLGGVIDSSIALDDDSAPVVKDTLAILASKVIIYIVVCVCVCGRVCVHVHVCACAHGCMCACVCVRACMRACVPACLPACLPARYLRMYKYMCALPSTCLVARSLSPVSTKMHVEDVVMCSSGTYVRTWSVLSLP